MSNLTLRGRACLIAAVGVLITVGSAGWLLTVALGAAAGTAARDPHALARPDLGRLVSGAKADLVLVDLANPWMMPARDPLRSLVFTGPPGRLL